MTRYSADPWHLQVSHDAGFFSCCTIRLRAIIDHYNEFRTLPEVESAHQWTRYKNEQEMRDHVDIAPVFFCTTDATRRNGHVRFSDDTKDQYGDYARINWPDVDFFVRRYFSPSEEVLRITAHLLTRYEIRPATTIVVLYRGNDKRRETKVPEYHQMLEAVVELRAELPHHRVLVQSDEAEFCDAMLAAIPDSFTIDETPKIPRSDSAVQYEFPPDDRRQHALDFLATMFVIASCDQIVLNRGNVGLWACLFRGSADGVRRVVV